MIKVIKVIYVATVWRYNLWCMVSQREVMGHKHTGKQVMLTMVLRRDKMVLFS